jgi:hypothetical protein
MARRGSLPPAFPLAMLASSLRRVLSGAIFRFT